MADFSFPAILISTSLVWVTYIFTTAFYNLYFHPLSKFPGPRLWAAFQFPMLYYMLKGDVPYRIKELHDKHGSVVRISPNELTFTDPSAWKDIYNNKEFIRPSQWGNRPPGVSAHSLISAPVAEHARFRKAMASTFSEKAVLLQEEIVRGYIDMLIAKLRGTTQEKEGNKAVDMVQWLNFATFDIISDLGWGESFHCLEKQEYHPWIMVVLQFRAILIGASLNYYPMLKALVVAITPSSAMWGLRMVLSTTEEKVKVRLNKKTERPDFISYILSHNDTSPSSKISEEEMIANSMALIVAGSESLTAALCATINILLTHLEEHAILKREIRSTFKSEENITAQSTKSLPYLHAVLQEGMRLCPPFADNMRRAVPKGDAMIAGYALPEGVTVGVLCFSMFRSASNFVHPDEFLPDRWLQGKVNVQYSKDKHEAYRPFSAGPHGCLGQQLAWVELRLILTRLIWNFEMEIPEGSQPLVWTSQNIFWVWDKKPVNVELKLAAGHGVHKEASA